MYIFKKSQKPDSASGSHICSIFEINKDYNKNMALFPGQLKTLFGEPIFISEEFDNLLKYVIDATDEFGNTLLLRYIPLAAVRLLAVFINRMKKHIKKLQKN